MEEMIGYCGYNCHLCPARSDDPAVRQKMVDGWRKIFGHENYTAESVRCDGCLSDGRIADKQCKARPCARERGLESCVDCDEFPCDKMRFLMGTLEGLMIWSYPRAASVTEEEYNLCMRQFNSMPNLVRILVDRGKLPSWLEAYVEAR
jgi:hypothetical protein